MNFSAPSLAGLTPNGMRPETAAKVYVLGFSILAFMVAYRVWQKQKSFAPLPPSPPAAASFLLGHISVMPHELQWETYGSWASTLGNVIYMSIFGQPMLIVNSIDDARNLMDKRGAIYSDRPRGVLFEDMLGMKSWLAFLRYGEQFRMQRRMMQQTFNSQAIKSLDEVLFRSIAVFLRKVIVDETSYIRENHQYVSSNVMKVTYGHIVDAGDDKYTKLAVEFGENMLSFDAPGSHIIDVLPFLRYYPKWLAFGSWRQCLERASLARKQYYELLDRPYDDVKASRGSQGRGPGLLPRLMDDYEALGTTDPEMEAHIKNVAAITYVASVDTTAIATEVFLLMMIYHPDVAKNAQEQIDSVVGSGRLPDLSDRRSLPLVDCIIREVLRIHPPAPLGLPHALTTEDMYNGWRIPKGTTILTNIWQMMREPKYFPLANKFDPMRHIDLVKSYDTPEQALNGFYPNDPNSIVFGFGRRICPGRYFADMSLWLVVACTLAAFDVKPWLNSETGGEELPEIKFMSGETSHVVPFKCRVVPRSSQHAQLVTDLAVGIQPYGGATF